MSAHARLPPSSAFRWMVCTPSAKLEAVFPNKSGIAADEGTLAHKLAETLAGFALKHIKLKQYNLTIAEIKKHALYAPAMMDYMETYTSFIMERYNMALASSKNSVIKLEKVVNLVKWIREGFGTIDVRIIGNAVLEIIDLKYGKGVEVSAEENKQMMIYALGVLEEYDLDYDIETIKMTIYQPRLDNISTFTMNASDLRAWGENELKPKAALAFEGEGELVPGDHCKFCRAAGECRALANFNLDMARMEFAEPALLSDQEIVEVLGKIKIFEAWTKSVRDHALTQAVTYGREWPEMKLVAGKSDRVYKDPEKIAQVLADEMYDESSIYKPREILSITALEAEIGKSEFGRLLSDYVVKPEGKPTLAPLSDKRPAFKGKARALSDFNDDLEDDL